VLQFNSNYVTAHFADLCVLHCYFQSVLMALLHSTFLLSECVVRSPETSTTDLVLCALAFCTSMLSLMVFALNFEKSKLYPAYFEYDALRRVKYLFADLYLYPSTYSIYKITVSSHHHEHHHNGQHHKRDRARNGNGDDGDDDEDEDEEDPLPPPTCHYPTTLPPSVRETDSDRMNRVETMSTHSPSDIFSDQNDHHDAHTLSARKRLLLVLCRFTFYLYLFADFWCRSSPFIILWIAYYHSPSHPQWDPSSWTNQKWLFWVNIAFLSAFSVLIVGHSLWLHRTFSDYFKPSAFFWSYTIKRYLHCHFVHPLRSILDGEPFVAFLLRNLLFWFGALLICNVSVFGFVFQRPTLYSRGGEVSWPRMRRRVERNIRCESLLRYFGGFVLILLFVITFDDDHALRQRVAYWTFTYCLLALFCFFMVNKLAATCLFRVDALWIMRVRKKGWLLSKEEEGLIWHRNYNKAQSFRIKRRQKQLRNRQRRKNRSKSKRDRDRKGDRKRRRDRDDGDDGASTDSEMNRYRAHNLDVDGIEEMADKMEMNAAVKISERQARAQSAAIRIAQRGRTDVAQHNASTQNELAVSVDVIGDADPTETEMTMPDHIATNSTSSAQKLFASNKDEKTERLLQ